MKYVWETFVKPFPSNLSTHTMSVPSNPIYFLLWRQVILEQQRHNTHTRKYDTLLFVLTSSEWMSKPRTIIMKKEKQTQWKKCVFAPSINNLLMSITVDVYRRSTLYISNDLANYYSMKHKIKHGTKILVWLFYFTYEHCPYNQRPTNEKVEVNHGTKYNESVYECSQLDLENAIFKNFASNAPERVHTIHDDWINDRFGVNILCTRRGEQNQWVGLIFFGNKCN